MTEVDARLVEALAGPGPDVDGSVATLAIDNGAGSPCDDKVFRRVFGDLRVAIASAAVGWMYLLNEDSNVLEGWADEKTASERLGSAGSSVRAEGWVAARTGLSPFPTSGALPLPLALLPAPLRVFERDAVATDALVLVLVDPVGTSTFPLPLPFAKDGVVDKSGMIVGSSPGDGESVLLHAGKKSVSDAARCELSSSKKLNDGRAAAPEGGEPNMAAPP